MKTKKKIGTIALVLAICIFTVFTLSGCYTIEYAGVKDATINENGELILSYSDGREQNLGVVVGSDGLDGENGQDGKDGKDGKDGQDGKDGEENITVDNGTVNIESSDNSESLATAVGLRSAVKVYCVYKQTVQGGYFPGISSGTPTTKTYASQGAGVIYSLDKEKGDAIVITNYHVVYDAGSDTENGISDDISLYLYGGEVSDNSIPAEYIGGSLYYDIAVLRVSGSEVLRESDAAPVKIADSDRISVGESAIAIGNPEGLGISATCGIISVDSEYITMTAADEKTTVTFRVMRIDTSINPGNSGGGLFNSSGELVGIVNAKISDSSIENIAYAIPTAIAIAVTENILDNCSDGEYEAPRRAVLGVILDCESSRAEYDRETGKISIVEKVIISNTPENEEVAEVLKEGDVVLSVRIGDNVKEITRRHHLIDFMLWARTGDTVVFTVERDGETVDVEFHVTEDCISSY